MSRILITGSRAPVALDLARALARAGHEVHVCDVRRGRMLGGFPQHVHAAPVQAPQRFAQDIVRLQAELAPDLIIPMCEEVFHLARVAVDHPLPLYAPPLGQLMSLHSKRDFNGWVRSLGLDAPETESIAAPVAPTPAGTWVFKPEFSRFGFRCYLSLGQKEAEYINKSGSTSWLRQTYVPGDDLCVHALAKDGRLTAFAAYRSDWRTKGGASYHFQPLEPDLVARLRDVARRLVAAGHLTGQIACDLRHDPDDRLWLIECNPRATSGLHLLTHDPEGLSRALFSNDGVCLEASLDPACVGLAMGLYGLPTALRNGRVKRWLRDAKARDVLKSARMGALADSLGYGLTAVLRGQSLAQVLTHDIECNGWPC
jgi:hypothetical protein